MSYRKKHVKSKIFRTKPKNSVFKKIRFWIFVLLLIAVFLALYFLLFYHKFQVQSVSVYGNNKVKTEDLQNIALDNSVAVLFNFWNIKIVSASIFLADSNKISQDIIENFPTIKTVVVQKNIPNVLSIIITEREPLGAYCPLNNTNGCFAIDNGGVAFEKLQHVPTDATIVRQINGDSQIALGEKVVNQGLIDAIYRIKRFLEDNFHINVQQALIASEYRLNVSTNQNWQVYFDISSNYDMGSQLTKLNLLLDGGISSDSMKSLRYIDLRPKDRAIVCDNNTCGK